MCDHFAALLHQARFIRLTDEVQGGAVIVVAEMSQ
jgi:hypothetical protein